MPPVCSSSDPESFCKSVDVKFKLLFIIMKYYFNEAFNKKVKISFVQCVCFLLLIISQKSILACSYTPRPVEGTLDALIIPTSI